MQEEFNSTSESAKEPSGLKPLSTPPEEVVCLIRVQGKYRTEIQEPVTGLTAVIRRVFRQSPWRMVAASGSTFNRGGMQEMDYSTIPQVLAAVTALREQLTGMLGPVFKTPDPAGEDRDRRVLHDQIVTEEVWLGRPGDFQPARFLHGLHEPKEGAAPVHLKGQDITAEKLAAGLEPFYTRDAHAWNALRVDKAMEESTVLQTSIKVGRPLRLGK
ncbi:MAG: hypothetical protein ACAH83_10385 [Alphaproteobacteria bacterium]